MDTFGNLLASFNSPGTVPSDLAWDGKYLWNLDKADGKIYRLDTSGRVLDSITAPGHINHYHAGGGLVWDGSHLWCTDDGFALGDHNKIYQLDRSGNVIASFSAPQSNSYSGGLTWDGNDLWYMCDYTNARLNNEIYKLSHDPLGYVHYHFDAANPGWSGLAWDGSRLWVADGWDDKIHQVDYEGNVLMSFESPGPSPIGLVCTDG